MMTGFNVLKLCWFWFDLNFFQTLFSLGAYTNIKVKIIIAVSISSLRWLISPFAYQCVRKFNGSLFVIFLVTGEMVADQYVYATVTGIATTTDERIIATTKLGYVIINKLDHRQSSCGSPMNQITRHESCSKNQVIRREKPQYRSVNDSTTCLLL